MDGTVAAILITAPALLFLAGVFYVILRRGRAQDHASADLVAELRAQLVREHERVDVAQARIVELESARSAAETRAEDAQRASEEQRRLWEEASRQLQDTFKVLATDALAESRDHLVKAAGELLAQATNKSASEFDLRRTSIEQMLGPLKEAIEAYKKESNELEELHLKQLGTVQEQYRELSGATSSLSTETAKLSNALRSPQVRGRWGQLTLRRTAELAGLVEHCDFYEQETVPAEGRRLRPDMLVRLPAHRLVVIDAKVPLDAYLNATTAESETERQSALRQHARQLKDHIQQLASKEYQDEFEDAPEFVVAFIPNEGILSAAIEKDPDLVEFSLARAVVVATPSTLFALLRAVAYGWRQEQIAEHAQLVSAMAQQLAERLGVMATHFDRVGSALRRAVEAYNETVGSLESRVLPAARRFRSQGVSSKIIPEVHQVEVAPRSLAAPMVTEGAQEMFPEMVISEEGGAAEKETGDEVLHLNMSIATFTCHCRTCGAAFEATGPNARYCSDQCRDKARSTGLQSEVSAGSPTVES